ncbi:MAG: hypothetical protein A2992_06655 [Elusimicrobia bacterium RIFCSPLOWO2_01_FULL_59_12]|nr:MAG: hypothetical protein A2992_06655 [Elusimicrobia bacterium RIFCSPLOWO2_01_FULL_59_12]
MLLAIDVGNTQITLGAFLGKALKRTWRLPTNPRATSKELGTQLVQLLKKASPTAFGGPPSPGRGGGGGEVLGVIIASVVPPIDAALAEACTRYLHCAPFMIGPQTQLGIKNLYKNPREVGADRLVNAVAVDALFGGPAIVVDFGTATTFDCVSSLGDYLGGVIAPGLEIAHDALAARAAKLSRVPFEVPRRVLGKTTKESLQSGLFFGYIALVEGVLQRLMKEMRVRPKIIATGGLSRIIGPRLKPAARVMPTLTLEGLRIVWERSNT